MHMHIIDASVHFLFRGWSKGFELSDLNDSSRKFLEGDTLAVFAELEVRLLAPGRQLAVEETKRDGYDKRLFVEMPHRELLCGVCVDSVMRDPVSCCPQGHECVVCHILCSTRVLLRH